MPFLLHLLQCFVLFLFLNVVLIFFFILCLTLSVKFPLLLLQ